MSPDLANTILAWSGVVMMGAFLVLIYAEMYNGMFGCDGKWRTIVVLQEIIISNGCHVSSTVLKKSELVAGIFHILLMILIFGCRDVIGCRQPWQSILMGLASSSFMIIEVTHKLSSLAGNDRGIVVRIIKFFCIAAVIAGSILGAAFVIKEISDYTIFEMTNVLLFWAVNLVVGVIYFKENIVHRGKKLKIEEIKKTQ